jgi:hypothetical protein
VGQGLPSVGKGSTPIIPAGNDEEARLEDAHSTFEDFYQANHRRLFVALCLITGSRQEAEEVMQETFVRLWKRRDRIDEVRDPPAFLFRTAISVSGRTLPLDMGAVRERVGDFSWQPIHP